MHTYNINGRQIEFDDTKLYLDFFLMEGDPQLLRVDWKMILEKIEAGELEWDDDLKNFIRPMSRWVHEAPRKRFYRDMQLKGANVMSTEYFFANNEQGGEWIDALENSGNMAARLCEAFSVEPMRPIKQDDPSRGIGGKHGVPGDLEDYEDMTKSPYRRRSN